MKTEYEKMVAGEMYDATDNELDKMRTNCRLLTREYNLSKADNEKKRQKILKKLFGREFENIIIQPSFQCDYGINITLGKNVFMNFNCVILDCAPVEIGDDTFLAPNVQIYTAAHPLDVKSRNTWLEYAKPVKIGKNCWIGGSSVFLPGVSVGDGCVIGAGAVVTKDIPSNSIAVGNPARVIRQIAQ